AGADPAAVAAAWRAADAAGGATSAAAEGAAAEGVKPAGSADSATRAAMAWTADAVTLFRSHLGRRPSYERIAAFPLGARS
ncbi:hypothetical protein LKX83_28690, partial [Cohnella sp. REN36]|nr:hypothetical protein [Cohnella sp. REN36]